MPRAMNVTDLPPHLARDAAIRCDADDQLRAFRDRFHVHPGTIYLDGNSLGLPCHDAEAAIAEALDAWPVVLDR